MREQKTWLHHRSSGLASVREVGRAPSTAARRPKNSGEEERLGSQHEERRPESRTWRHRPSSVRVYTYLNVLAFEPFTRRYAGARPRCCIRTVKEFATVPEERGWPGARSRRLQDTTRMSYPRWEMHRDWRVCRKQTPQYLLSANSVVGTIIVGGSSIGASLLPSSACHRRGSPRGPQASRPRR